MTADSKNTGRDSDKFMLRFPDGMRDVIKRDADKNGRSMNAEIIARLKEALFDPCYPKGTPWRNPWSDEPRLDGRPVEHPVSIYDDAPAAKRLSAEGQQLLESIQIIMERRDEEIRELILRQTEKKNDEAS